MNTDWAIAELDKFITQTVMRNGSGSSGGVSFLTNTNYTSAPDAEVTKQAQVVEQIFDRVIRKWPIEIANSKNNRWTRHREAALRAREQLGREREVRENLGENAPRLSAADLHDWLWSGAKSLWQSGHYREAVEGAIKKLNAETQNKVARRDVSERPVQAGVQSRPCRNRKDTASSNGVGQQRHLQVDTARSDGLRRGRVREHPEPTQP